MYEIIQKYLKDNGYKIEVGSPFTADHELLFRGELTSVLGYGVREANQILQIAAFAKSSIVETVVKMTAIRNENSIIKAANEAQSARSSAAFASAEAAMATKEAEIAMVKAKAAEERAEAAVEQAASAQEVAEKIIEEAEAEATIESAEAEKAIEEIRLEEAEKANAGAVPAVTVEAPVAEETVEAEAPVAEETVEAEAPVAEETVEKIMTDSTLDVTSESMTIVEATEPESIANVEFAEAAVSEKLDETPADTEREPVGKEAESNVENANEDNAIIADTDTDTDVKSTRETK